MGDPAGPDVVSLVDQPTDEPPLRPAKRFKLTSGLKPQVLSLVESDEDDSLTSRLKPGDAAGQSGERLEEHPGARVLWGALQDPQDAAAAARGPDRPIYRPPSVRSRRMGLVQQPPQQQPRGALPISPIVIDDEEDRPERPNTLAARRESLMRQLAGAGRSAAAGPGHTQGQGTGHGLPGPANEDSDSPLLTKVVPGRGPQAAGPGGAARAGALGAAAAGGASWGAAAHGPIAGGAGAGAWPGSGFVTGPGDAALPPEAALAQMQLRSPPHRRAGAQRAAQQQQEQPGPAEGQQGPGEPLGRGQPESPLQQRTLSARLAARFGMPFGAFLQARRSGPSAAASGGYGGGGGGAGSSDGPSGGGGGGNAAAVAAAGRAGAGSSRGSSPPRVGRSTSPSSSEQEEADLRLAARLQAEEDERLARETARRMEAEDQHGQIMAEAIRPWAAAVVAAAPQSATAHDSRALRSPDGFAAGPAGDGESAPALAARWSRLNMYETLEEEARRQVEAAGGARRGGRGGASAAAQRAAAAAAARAEREVQREMAREHAQHLRDHIEMVNAMHAVRAARGPRGPEGGGGYAMLFGGGGGGAGPGAGSLAAAAALAAEAAAAADAGAAVPGGGGGGGGGLGGRPPWSARNMNDMLPVALGLPYGLMGRAMMGGGSDDDGPGAMYARHRRARNAAREAALSMRDQLMAAQRAGIPPSLLLSDRDFTPEDYDLLLRLDEGVENRKGAREEQLEALPTQVVAQGGRRGSDGAPARCAVCLEEVAGGDVLKRLPCAHDFHAGCVDTWLRTKACCPICQRGIEE